MWTTWFTAKVLLVGESSVGKTSLIERIMRGHFVYYRPLDPRERVPPLLYSERVHTMLFETNCGQILYDFWEMVDCDDTNDLLHAQGAIIMFDANDRSSLTNVLKLYRDIVRVCEKIPIVICRNKADGKRQGTIPTEIRLDREVTLPYFEISTITSTDEVLHEPFLWLTRKLLRPQYAGPADEIVFEYPTYGDPPENPMSYEQIALLEAEAALAAYAAPLPDEDEDL